MSESKKVYESISTRPVTENLGKVVDKFENQYVAIFTYADGGQVILGLPNHFYVAYQHKDKFEYKTF